MALLDVAKHTFLLLSQEERAEFIAFVDRCDERRAGASEASFDSDDERRDEVVGDLSSCTYDAARRMLVHRTPSMQDRSGVGASADHGGGIGASAATHATLSSSPFLLHQPPPEVSPLPSAPSYLPTPPPSIFAPSDAGDPPSAGPATTSTPSPRRAPPPLARTPSSIIDVHEVTPALRPLQLPGTRMRDLARRYGET